MREIKFRVWTGTTMEYDVMVGRFGAFYVNQGTKGDGRDPADAASLSPFNTKYSAEMPLMQFTGLRDKDGTEIWEGDLVIGKDAYKQLQFSWSVAIDECGVRLFLYRSVSHNEIHITTPTQLMPGSAKEFLVIGNIHEGIKEAK